MRTCGADPRGVRVEWRDGGGRTRLVGVTELGRMMETDPNLALWVLDGVGRWEAGKSAGGIDPQRKGWVRVKDWAGETSSRRSWCCCCCCTGGGGRTAPQRPPKPPKGPQ